MTLLFLFFIVNCNAQESGQESILNQGPLAEPQYTEEEITKALTFKSYKEIKIEYRKLEPAEEKELFEEYKKGNQRAFNILFLSNVYLVEHEAWRFGRVDPSSYEDYYQEGLMALLDSVKSFPRKERKVKFSTYARKAIRRRISKYEKEENRLIPIKTTPSTHKPLIILQKKMISFTDNLNRQLEEINKEFPEYSVEKMRALVTNFLNRQHIDIDLVNLPAEDTDITLGRDSETMQQWAIRRFKQKSKIYKIIIQNHLFSDDPQTIEEIADEFNVTRQNVNQAKLQIRRILREEFYRDFHNNCSQSFTAVASVKKSL